MQNEKTEKKISLFGFMTNLQISPSQVISVIIPAEQVMSKNGLPHVVTIDFLINIGVDLKTVIIADTGEKVFSDTQISYQRKIYAELHNNDTAEHSDEIETDLSRKESYSAKEQGKRPALHFFDKVENPSQDDSNADSSSRKLSSQDNSLSDNGVIPIEKVLNRTLTTAVKTDPSFLLAKDSIDKTIEPPQNKEISSDFIVEDIPALKGDRNGYIVSMIRELTSVYMLKIHSGKIWIFENGCYKALSKPDFCFLINERFGDELDIMGSSAYEEVYRLMSVQSIIHVSDDYLLPPYLWIFSNCIIDADNMKKVRNNGELFVTNSLKCIYDEDASCPEFDKFMESICDGNEKLLTRLWEVIGIILSNDQRAKSFYLFVGPKDTGKSVLIKVIADIIGKDSIATLKPIDFSRQFDVADLVGKHLNFCADISGKSLDEHAVSMIKSLTGGDVVRSDRKFQDSISFINTAHLLFASNHMITPNTPDSAFVDRMVVIPFNHVIPKERQNKDLPMLLLKEKAGIARKALSYYRKLVSDKYIFGSLDTPVPIGKTIDYKKVIDTFVTEIYSFTEDEHKVIPAKDFYGKFLDYLNEQEIYQAISYIDFGKYIQELYPDKVKKVKKRVGEYKNPVAVYTNLQIK